MSRTLGCSLLNGIRCGADALPLPACALLPLLRLYRKMSRQRRALRHNHWRLRSKPARLSQLQNILKTSRARPPISVNVKSPDRPATAGVEGVRVVQ